MSTVRNRPNLFRIKFDQPQSPNMLNNTTEYYAKLLNDPLINKLIFSYDNESDSTRPLLPTTTDAHAPNTSTTSDVPTSNNNGTTDPPIVSSSKTLSTQEFPFIISDFDEIDTIATTRHVIRKMLHKPSKKELAVKFVHIPHNRHSTDDENLKKLKYLVREIQNFCNLKNQATIVNFYGFCLHEGQALICMELMDLSLKELSLRFIENKQRFPEELLRCVIVSVLQALKICKEQKIIHRDVKPDNVLLGRNGTIKLCDFGESRILHDSLASTFAGSLSYWPPERFNHEKAKFDVRADIWSLGITLIELVTGTVPYKDHKGNIPNNIILLQNLIVTLDTNATVDKELERYTNKLKDFIKLCLRPVEERPKYDQLIETELYQHSLKRINLERTVKTVLKNFYGNEQSVEDIRQNLREIAYADKMVQIKASFDQLFHKFYALEMSGQILNPAINMDAQIIDLVHQIANNNNFLFYLSSFIEQVSEVKANREGNAIEIYQIRSGIQCFIDLFKPIIEQNDNLRELTKKEGYIEELDELIETTKFFCLDKNQTHGSFLEALRRKKHWWQFI